MNNSAHQCDAIPAGIRIEHDSGLSQGPSALLADAGI